MNNISVVRPTTGARLYVGPGLLVGVRSSVGVEFVDADSLVDVDIDVEVIDSTQLVDSATPPAPFSSQPSIPESHAVKSVSVPHTLWSQATPYSWLLDY